MFFLSSADFFSKSTFSKNSLENIIVSNSLDSDQARHFVRPDLDPNCLKRLSADDISRKRVDSVLTCKAVDLEYTTSSSTPTAVTKASILPRES